MEGRELLYRDEVYAVIGAAIEVHRQHGSGFAEAIYQESMEIELGIRGIPFRRQVPLNVHYKGQLLEKGFTADLVCYDCVLVELKSLTKMSGTEEAQVLNYLKASGLRVGLLINFGDPVRLDWHRFIR
jgi:GxxExxY protein